MVMMLVWRDMLILLCVLRVVQSRHTISVGGRQINGVVAIRRLTF